MLRVFRKLKQTVVLDGKLRPYLLYAAGEIVLVVVGILIALQINAVYEDRMDRRDARRVLSRLVMDIDADFERLTFIDTTYASSLGEIREIYDILAMDRIEDVELVEKAALYDGADIKDVNSVRATFDEMVNSGNIYKLENEDLIRQIIEYYRLVDENTFQSREDRREFRRFLYSPEMLDYFYIRSATANQLEIAREFLSDRESKNFRRLVQMVNWSGGQMNRGRARNSELMERNRALRDLLVRAIE